MNNLLSYLSCFNLTIGDGGLLTTLSGVNKLSQLGLSYGVFFGKSGAFGKSAVVGLVEAWAKRSLAVGASGFEPVPRKSCFA